MVWITGNADRIPSSSVDKNRHLSTVNNAVVVSVCLTVWQRIVRERFHLVQVVIPGLPSFLVNFVRTGWYSVLHLYNYFGAFSQINRHQRAEYSGVKNCGNVATHNVSILRPLCMSPSFGQSLGNRPIYQPNFLLVSCSYASMYFSRVRVTTSSGSAGGGLFLSHEVVSSQSRTNCLSNDGWPCPG